MNEVQTYPLNADKLNKGDTIDQQVIAEYLGVPINSRGYELGVLELAEKIARVLRRAQKPCTVVRTGRADPMGAGAIRVLTDEEALIYNGRGFKRGLRQSFRKHARTLEIDPSQLSPQALKNFERNLVVQGAVLSSITSTRAKAVLKSVERKAPPMIEHQADPFRQG